MTVTREQMQNAVRNYNNIEEIRRIAEELNVLRQYIIVEFGKVSKRYNCVAPTITEGWAFDVIKYLPY
jgi:hypothetical protein